MVKVEITLPIRTRSEANLREHWAIKCRRVKSQREETKLSCFNALRGMRGSRNLHITLTRIAPRKLDSDNLARSLKAVRDGIADVLKIDDGSSRIEWRYAQGKGKPKEYAVRVEVNSWGPQR